MSATAPRQTILSLPLADKDQVYESWMPFLKNGGLFVRSPRKHELGDPVFLLVTLPGSAERLPVSGKVAWITFERAQGNRYPGIGVQFDDTAEAAALRGRIEVEIAGVDAERPTATM